MGAHALIRDADDDASLCVRAVWLNYGAGLTQAEVAKRLGISSLKVHRLIARANREGVVKISIDGEIADCLRLGEALCRRHGLKYCEVAPDLDENDLPLRALGLAGSRFLRLALEDGEEASIGIGHGRTLAACVDMLPRMNVPDAKLVSLLGGISHNFAATPFDVIHRLADRTRARAYVLPIPFFANSAEDRAVLLAQRGIEAVMAMGVATTLRLVGVGTLEEAAASILSTGMIEAEHFARARGDGGVGEVLGHVFDRDGRLVETEISARTLSMAAADIGRERTIAVAGGRSKVEAIRAVLASGLIHGLITDERSAKALLD
jgi:DNA-binding transcriptional regulator LsrR (DeoR family)